MRQIKSERLKKLEVELQDLEQWMKLGLVPKKDIAKHKEEMESIRDKIDEEKERLRFLRESGDLEEYVTPKRTASRTAYTDMPSLPDMEVPETGGVTEVGYETPTEVNDNEATDEEATEEHDIEEDETEVSERPETTSSDDDEDSFFDDRKRWQRGGIVDPDADDW